MKNSGGALPQKSQKRSHHDYNKKQVVFVSPDLHQLQEVVIDYKTKIYIAIGASAEEARSRYLTRMESKTKPRFGNNKPAISAKK